jgi:hypothetical protein
MAIKFLWSLTFLRLTLRGTLPLGFTFWPTFNGAQVGSFLGVQSVQAGDCRVHQWDKQSSLHGAQLPWDPTWEAQSLGDCHYVLVKVGLDLVLGKRTRNTKWGLFMFSPIILFFTTCHFITVCLWAQFSKIILGTFDRAQHVRKFKWIFCYVFL